MQWLFITTDENLLSFRLSDFDFVFLLSSMMMNGRYIGGAAGRSNPGNNPTPLSTLIASTGGGSEKAVSRACNGSLSTLVPAPCVGNRDHYGEYKSIQILHSNCTAPYTAPWVIQRHTSMRSLSILVIIATPTFNKMSTGSVMKITKRITLLLCLP